MLASPRNGPAAFARSMLMATTWNTRRDGVSAHAAVRMQQRGIRADALDLLFRYGREEHDHRGGIVLYLDKPARARIARECGTAAIRSMGSRFRVYAVLGRSGDVVTVGHRYARIWRH
jgi:hypothetical protein